MLDWRIGETVALYKRLNVYDIEGEELLQLCFNIWPRGNGILHYLSMYEIEK